MPIRPGPKLIAPRSAHIVRRARVVMAIERALRAGICWIAAPAGYGKTTAVVDYLDRHPQPHVWYRVDEGDQDVASFFSYLSSTIKAARASSRLPVFGPEYADQTEEFSRRFFRSYFERLGTTAMWVFDDLHYADTPQFRAVLGIMLRELPDGAHCVCLSRSLPPPELRELTLKGRLSRIDQSVLQFSDREARVLVASRVPRKASSVDFTAAHGWAAGLVLLADRAAAGGSQSTAATGGAASRRARPIVFGELATQLFDSLSTEEQDLLLKLSLLPEITVDLAQTLTGSQHARALLERLHERQLLVNRGDTARASYHLHDLLRDYLKERVAEHMPSEDLAKLRERAAIALHAAGHIDGAIDLALQARAWSRAREYIVARADGLLAEGRRATLIDWCQALPEAELDGWLCYWLGVANMADDATAEAWLARAWARFSEQGKLDGQCLTAARAVLAKTDSWRTHEGLAAWTGRVIDLIDRDFPSLSEADQLLARAGMLRAVDFAQDYQSDNPAVERLTLRLLERLATRVPSDVANLRLLASATLIDHAGSTGKAEVFERAVDSVVEDLRDRDVSPWVLGVWLVTFGSVTSRYFSYARRGFPFATPEAALRAAVAIGEHEALRGVEFGGLYHLQLLMKMNNDWSEFATLIDRIGSIADSRYTTQVAVAADCQAALYTMQGRLADAYAACERFMAAIEAANEPPIERWPHFITRFQVLLADRKPTEAAAFLEEMLPLFDGAVGQRTQLCVLAARALEAKWCGSQQYVSRLRACVQEMRAANWSAVLINQPALLAMLCADALELVIETDYCRALIRRRKLAPPQSKPRDWPWSLKIHVLGSFRMERDGEPLGIGSKAPTRSLDLLRALAISKDQTCSLGDLYTWLWPDADGDRAKSACEQALHRLRKLLGSPELLVQREGRLQLSPELVWIDLESWERDLARALAPADASGSAQERMRRAFESFGGPLLQSERVGSWSLTVAERVRSKFVDLALRLARSLEAADGHAAARGVYLRALDMYPTSARCYEGLIRNRLAKNDHAGALEDYQRYTRMLASNREIASPAIRALVAPLLRP